MNCQLCQKEMDAYIDGILPHDMRALVESHLEVCETCSGIYKLLVFTNKTIDKEKQSEPDTFLETRVMAYINSLEDSPDVPATLFKRIVKPALISVSLAAAIIFGIFIGNLPFYDTDREAIPAELALIDDIAIESVSILLNE